MAARWRILEADEESVHHLSESLHLNPAIARLLVTRGIRSSEQAQSFLNKSMNDLVGPFELQGMLEAVERLVRAIQNSEKILIHGDFDADGITSTALLTLFIRELGGEVIPFVPNRLVEGHGISPRAIEIAESENVNLFITCDCGTSSAKEVLKLSQAGIETIITDHHSIPSELPKGALLVNPKFGTSDKAHDDLSGVGVAFMLAVGVRARLRELSFFATRAEPNLKSLLDIVALGTLADMAPLQGQNRILVAHGLNQIGCSKRPAFLAMRSFKGLSGSQGIDAMDVGFRFAPKINAAARLGHAEDALEFLVTSDSNRAEKLAKKMEEWNQERRSKQEWMTRIASSDAERQVSEGRRSIVVSSPEFHPGIIGLVAQKLSQTYGRPAFVFTIEGEVARGSARARGVDLISALEYCSDLFDHFGGHKEAGGGSLPTARLGEFKTRFEQALEVQGIAALQEVLIDAELNLRHLNDEVVSSLRQLGPFGMGNPEPVFLAKARTLGLPREVGQGHLRMTLVDGNSAGSFGAIGFGLWSECGGMKDWVEVAYTPEVTLWKGRRSIELRLRSVRNA